MTLSDSNRDFEVTIFLNVVSNNEDGTRWSYTYNGRIIGKVAVSVSQYTGITDLIVT